MKKILTILLLIVVSICKGQDRTTSFLNTKDLDSVITSAINRPLIVNQSYNWELQHTKNFDTSNVTLICIDSGKETGPTFFIKAIKINKFVAGGWNTGDYYLPAHWEHFCYLTKNMKTFQFTVIQCISSTTIFKN